MADVRQNNDGNLAWLKKRLRGQWSAAGMGSALTRDTLESVTQSFHLLDSQIRVRVLLSILSLRPKELVALKPQLAPLLEIAKVDVDEWVKSVYCLVRQYVDTSSLHELIEQGSDLSQKQVAAFNVAMTTVRDADWNNTNSYYPLETGLLNPSISGLGNNKPQHEHNHFVLKKMPARAVTSTQRDEDKIVVGGGGGGSRLWIGGKSSNLKSTNTTGASSRSVGAGFGLGRATVRRSQLLPPDRRSSQPISPNAISASGSRRDFLKNISHTKSTKRDGVKLLDTDELPPTLQARKRSRTDVTATDKGGKQAVPPPPTTPQVTPQAPFSAMPDGYSHMGTTSDSSTPVESGMPASYGLAPTSALYGAQPTPTTETAPMEYSSADAVKIHINDDDAKSVGSPTKAAVDTTPTHVVAPSPRKQPVAPPTPVVSEQTLNDIFSQSNRLSKEDRATIERFLQRKPVPTNGKDIAQIVLHEERSPGPTPQSVIIEQFVFEMTFATGDWRRLKRKRKVNMKAPQAS